MKKAMTLSNLRGKTAPAVGPSVIERSCIGFSLRLSFLSIFRMSKLVDLHNTISTTKQPILLQQIVPRFHYLIFLSSRGMNSRYSLPQGEEERRVRTGNSSFQAQEAKLRDLFFANIFSDQRNSKENQSLRRICFRMISFTRPVIGKLSLMGVVDPKM